MSTTIDSLNIEIQSNSASATNAIKDLAKSLGELKSNGTVTTAIKNLNNLSAALKGFTDASNATRSLGKLVGALSRLKEVGPVGSVGNSLTKLSTSLKALETVDIDNVGSRIEKIAQAVSPLSSVKAGGLGTMVNALSKIGKVTADLDDEKIAAFAERIEKLTTTLEPLSTKMTTIQAGLKGVNSSARSAGSGVKQMGDDVDGASVNFASFIYIIQEAVQWIQNAAQRFSEFINAASEWDGIAARFGRGFGSQAQETYDWIQRLNEEMGINVQQFMQYSSIYATMLQGFGVAHEDATKMALGYTELTYDIWAGYNDVYKSFEEASEAVKSAIAGEVEPIRRAGFTIVESTLEQTAANHGLSISLEKASESQKSYLRYLTLVDQAHAQNLVGTYAKELQTAEGLMRTFSQQTKSLSQTFGSLFLPILVKIMPYLQAFVELLTDAVRWIGGIFGIEIQKVDFSGYEAGAGAVQDVADSALGATDALGSAAKAAKELKNATLGIDELNVISPPSSSGGSGGAGGGAGGAGGGSGFDGLDVDSLWDESIFDGIQTQIDEIKEKLKSWLPVVSTIAGALGGLALTSLIKSIGDAMAEFSILQKAFASVATLAIEAALVFIFADNYLESGNLLNLVGEALVTATSGYLMFRAWGPAGATLALGVSVLAQLLALKMSLADGTVSLSSPETWIQGISTMLMGAFGGMLISKYTGFFAKEGFVIGLSVTAALTLAAIRMGAIESGEISSDSAEAWILEIGSVITAGLAGKWLGSALYAAGGPMGALIGVTAGLVLNLVGTISVKGEDFGNEISDWVNVAITTAMAAFTGAKLWKLVSPFITPALSALIPQIGGVLTTALSGLGTVIAAAGGGWVVAAVAAIVGTITLAFVDYDFTNVGYTIGEKIGSAFKAVGGWFKDVGTAIKDGVTAAFKWVKENFDINSVWDLIFLIFNPSAWLLKILPKLFEVGREVLPGLWDGIMEKWDNLVSNIGEFIDGFIQGFKDGLGIASPSTVFADMGKWLVEGLWQGIKDKANWIIEKIGGWVDDVLASVKSFFGIASPSKEFKSIGGFLTDGLIEGITGKASETWDALSDWAGGIVDKAKDFFGFGTPSLSFGVSPKNDSSQWWTDVKKWWGEKVGAVSNFKTGVSNSSKTWWANAKKWWSEKVGSVSNFKTGVSNSSKTWWSNTKKWWSQKVGSVASFKVNVQNNAATWWSNVKKWWKQKAGSLSTKLNISVPSIKVNWDTASAFGKEFKYPTGFKLKFAAAGGIFDAGSLIWAGERGAEVVANAGGGKTGVMNVQQMSDAVYEGVFAAVMAANRAAADESSPAFNIYLDGKQITATVEKRQRERGTTIMGNQVYNFG